MLVPVPLLVLAQLPASQASSPGSLDQLEFFESNIRPVLVEHCYACHSSAGKAEGGIQLDHRAGMLEESLFGPVVSPGDPGESVLLQVMRHELEGLEMPEGGARLDDQVLADFEAWILAGAADPRDEPPGAAEVEALLSWEARLARRMDWWSLQPVEDPPLPEVAGADHPVDRFIGARLREQGLQPAGPAPRRELHRRLTHVLTGLPPSPEELQRFEADPRPDAYERLVDRLLASPHFGERWARHWMDVVRYADSHGSEGDPQIPFAYRYRDYLIRAFNEDLPYDRFVREHVAGDLLEPRLDAEGRLNESILATAHWRLVYHGYLPTDPLDEKVRFVDDQINVLGKAFQAQTISCARCHDHKFDAISQADYTALFGVLASCRPGILDANAGPLDGAVNMELGALRGGLRGALAEDWLTALLDASSLERLQRAAGGELEGDHPLRAVQRAAADPGWRRDAADAAARTIGAGAAGNTERWELTDPEEAERWFAHGPGLEAGPVQAGHFTVATEGPEALTGIYPGGLYSHLTSTRHRGVLQSRRLDLGEDLALWGLVAGEGARFRHVVQDYPRQGTVYQTAGIGGGGWDWKRLDLAYWAGDSIHVELVTGQDAPVEITGGDRSWFGVREVALLPRGEEPARDPGPADTLLRLMASSGDGASPAAAAREALRGVVLRWAAATSTDAEALLLDACLRHGVLPNELDVLRDAGPLVERYRALEAEVPAPTRVPGLLEADAADWPLFERGDHRRPTAPVERRFLEAIDPTPFDADGSGRLQLADALAAPSNPLTARVMVNRVWHHLFGRGLVATPDNFGRLGARPSHPLLLDHLAKEFVRGGWSVKELIRHMVTSDAFMRSADASPEALERDPENALLSHASIRRMDAESIRDAMVEVAGALDERMYGPPAAPGPGTTRRSVYVRAKRNRMDPFLLAFDAPVPFAPVGARPTTTVPAQSLTLLNDPLTWDLAGRWAERARGADGSDAERLSGMWEAAIGRPPGDGERELLLRHLAACADEARETAGQRARLEGDVATARASVERLLGQARAALEARAVTADGGEVSEVRGPEAIAVWDFTRGPEALEAPPRLTLHGTARLEGRGLILDGEGHASTGGIDLPLGPRTLAAWVQLDDLGQRGGGVVSVQNRDGGQFDALVFGERRARRWVPGSDNFKRTADLDGEDESGGADPVHLVLSYADDGTVTAYRNGSLLGHPIRTAPLAEYRAGDWNILLGLRHGAPAASRLFRGTVLRAAVHGHAFSAEDALAAFEGRAPVLREDLIAALSPAEQTQLLDAEDRLAKGRAALDALGPPSGRDEPWTRVAHALFNLKEFIHVR
jgi:hypothetical protein